MVADDGDRRRPEGERTAVVAEPAPGAEYRRRRGRGERLDGRELGEEPRPVPGGSGRLRLLRHRLGDEDLVRIHGGAEGKVSAAGRVPTQDCVPELRRYGDRGHRRTIPGMRIGAAFWIQRTDWPSLRDACLAAEAAGFDAIWLDDHLLTDEGDWTAPKLEGWATLAALAPLTTRPELGLMVSANTFRNPGLTAKLAITLDHLSGGRAVLGMGGGWFEREHDAFGIDFGSGFGDRLDRLDEAVMLIRRLVDGERFSHEGRFYTFHDALCEPQPIRRPLPILIGGSGPKKTLRTTAKYADRWNGYGTVERIAATSEVLRERCAEVGRPFEAIRRTVTSEIVIRDTEAEALAAFDEVEERHGLRGRTGSDGSDRGLDVGGPPEAVAAVLRPYREIGIDEVLCTFRSPFDLETIRRIGEVRALLG